MKLKRKSWVMRLPLGLRDQPAWVFIGTLAAITGLSYLLGLARSATIATILAQEWVRAWGGFLFISGVLVVIATIAANKPLERLSLRFLSLGFFVYMCWILTAVPLSRATLTAATCLSLIGLAEIRVAVLKIVLRPLPVMFRGESDQ